MTSEFWKIEESVNRSRYITLGGIYSTKEEAELAIAHYPSNAGMRAVLYRTGHSTHGPERVEVQS